jgi:hypothetical protein
MALGLGWTQRSGEGQGCRVTPAFDLGLLAAWAICVVGGSALLHECGHAWTARAVGWEVVGLRWRWYGVAVVADPNGRSEQLWKVALGGLCATALLALGFLAGTALPEPAPLIFGLGFAFNATLLLTNLVPIPSVRRRAGARGVEASPIWRAPLRDLVPPAIRLPVGTRAQGFQLACRGDRSDRGSCQGHARSVAPPAHRACDSSILRRRSAPGSTPTDVPGYR